VRGGLGIPSWSFMPPSWMVHVILISPSSSSCIFKLAVIDIAHQPCVPVDAEEQRKVATVDRNDADFPGLHRWLSGVQPSLWKSARVLLSCPFQTSSPQPAIYVCMDTPTTASSGSFCLAKSVAPRKNFHGRPPATLVLRKAPKTWVLEIDCPGRGTATHISFPDHSF